MRPSTTLRFTTTGADAPSQIVIDGRPYAMRTPGHLPLQQAIALEELAPQLFAVSTRLKGEHPTAADYQTLVDLCREYAALVVDAPRAVLARLGDVDVLQIVSGFVDLADQAAASAPVPGGWS